MKVEIYTDGACSGNPGPGGWGALISCASKKKEISGFVENTTNNRMEIKAAIEALKALNKKCDVDIYTDSTYVREGITNWISKWQKNKWRTAANKPVKNQDLWQELVDLVSMHNVCWHWVKGHSGNAGNDRADALAVSAIQNNTNK